jgi:hypothetical protein
MPLIAIELAAPRTIGQIPICFIARTDLRAGSPRLAGVALCHLPADEAQGLVWPPVKCHQRALHANPKAPETSRPAAGLSRLSLRLLPCIRAVCSGANPARDRARPSTRPRWRRPRACSRLRSGRGSRSGAGWRKAAYRPQRGTRRRTGLTRSLNSAKGERALAAS